MMSAKNGGLQTLPPPLISQNQKLAYPPSPLSEKNQKMASRPYPPRQKLHLVALYFKNKFHFMGRNFVFGNNVNMCKVIK